MIFGDGGYGIIIVLAALFGLLSAIFKGKKPAGAMFLLLLIGLSTMGWGMITCSWFGMDTNLLPQWLKDLSVPALSNVTANISSEMDTYVSQNIQIFCFTLALIQLSIAHLKGIFRYIKSLKCLGELGSLVMLWGIYLVVLNMVVSAERFPMPSYTVPLVLGGFLFNFIFGNYAGNFGAGLAESAKNIVSLLLGVVNVFSDVVSYIRLWAVGLAGGAIASTVNEMAGPMMGGAMICAAILLLFFGHGLNMILNVLSVIVHGVRLNTLEFSNHLGMSWSGFSYKPFSDKV
jgi:V/A-type H+-transporting ATPase subunit I